MHSVAICICLILLNNVTLETFGCGDGDKAREHKIHMANMEREHEEHVKFLKKCYGLGPKECAKAKFTDLKGMTLTCYFDEKQNRCLTNVIKPVPKPGSGTTTNKVDNSV
ncbi:hypothetical protein GPALN_014133 [Globodera pallida]|nr:hypothetical protein GPALN_014133 [Globodera pallida]